jgi:hypothetical protein
MNDDPHAAARGIMRGVLWGILFFVAIFTGIIWIINTFLM